MCYLAYNALLGVQITLLGIQSSLFGVQARNKLTIRQYVKSTQAKSARNQQNHSKWRLIVLNLLLDLSGVCMKIM